MSIGLMLFLVAALFYLIVLMTALKVGEPRFYSIGPWLQLYRDLPGKFN